jgi:hypothetical protein
LAIFVISLLLEEAELDAPLPPARLVLILIRCDLLLQLSILSGELRLRYLDLGLDCLDLDQNFLDLISEALIARIVLVGALLQSLQLTVDLGRQFLVLVVDFHQLSGESLLLLGD